MLIIMEITLINKCQKILLDLVDNPSRIFQNATLISWEVTAQLTSAFVFTYVETRYSHDLTLTKRIILRNANFKKCSFLGENLPVQTKNGNFVMVTDTTGFISV